MEARPPIRRSVAVALSVQPAGGRQRLCPEFGVHLVPRTDHAGVDDISALLWCHPVHFRRSDDPPWRSHGPTLLPLQNPHRPPTPRPCDPRCIRNVSIRRAPACVAECCLLPCCPRTPLLSWAFTAEGSTGQHQRIRLQPALGAGGREFESPLPDWRDESPRLGHRGRSRLGGRDRPAHVSAMYQTPVRAMMHDPVV
jgi:hypothetical protein